MKSQLQLLPLYDTLDNGTIKSKESGKIYKFTPIPPFMQELVSCGGLMNYAKKAK